MIVRCTDGEGYEAAGAHIGLAFIIGALAASRIQPKLLDIAIELQNPGSIIVDTATDCFSFVCEQVEALTLRDKYYIFDAAGPQDLIVPVTKAMFPLLRSLIIDHNGYQRSNDITVTEPDNTPELRHLTIIDGSTHENLHVTTTSVLRAATAIFRADPLSATGPRRSRRDLDESRPEDLKDERSP